MSRRKLGAFELAQALTAERSPLNAVAVLEIEGGLPPALLVRALAHLQARHALLGAGIESRGRERYFVSGAVLAGAVPAIPVEVGPWRGEGGWIPAVEAELVRPFPARGPLLRCRLLGGGDPEGRGDLLLTFHHAAMDAASGISLLRELFALCRELAAGGEPAVPPSPPPLPPPADARFPRRFLGLRGFGAILPFLVRQGVDEIRYRRRGAPLPPPAAPARCRVLPVEIPEGATESLVRICRRRRLTLASVLQAAVLLAAARSFFAGRPHLLLRHVTFTDLRPHLEPPAGPEELGSFFTMLRLSVEFAAGAELWSVARAVQDEITSAGRRGERFTASRLSPHVMRALLEKGTERMGATALSYPGPLELSLPEPWHLRGFHAFVSNLDLGPLWTAQVRLFRGRLIWDFLYLAGDLEGAAAEALVGEILRLLSVAGEEASDE